MYLTYAYILGMMSPILAVKLLQHVTIFAVDVKTYSFYNVSMLPDLTFLTPSSFSPPHNQAHSDRIVCKLYSQQQVLNCCPAATEKAISSIKSIHIKT